MPDISTLLRSIGFVDSEVKTYLAALEAGAQTASQLSASTKLSRQATYTAIEALTDRGLMTSVDREGGRMFSAESPSKLLAYAKRHEMEISGKVKDLEDVLPELELRTGGDRPVVRMYEGKEGIKAIHEEVLKMEDLHVCEMLDSVTMRKVIKTEELQGMRKDAGNRGATSLGFYTGELYLPDAGIKAERYVLPESMWGFSSQILLIRDKVILFDFTGKMHAIVIEDPAIANGIRNLFSLSRHAMIAEQKSNPPMYHVDEEHLKHVAMEAIRTASV